MHSVFAGFWNSLNVMERRWLRWTIIAALLFISLPYFWAAAITPPGYEYQGLLYNPDDQNVHLAWARQAATGQFFFRDLFTTEGLTNDTRPLFTNLLCWLMGVLSAITRLPPVWIYHALRLLSAAFALFWFYALSTQLTPDTRIRRIALLLVAFSSGAGWLWPVLPNHIFIDRPDLPNFPMMPVAFTFNSSFIFTLNIASMALLALIYALTLRAQQTGNLRLAIGAGLAALMLSNIHTYDALPLIAALLIWMVLSIKDGRTLQGQKNRTRWTAPLIVIGCSLPPILYQIIVFYFSPEFQIKASTPTPAPPILDVVLSYGPLMVLACIGAWISRRDPYIRLMILWAVATLLAIYMPVSFARKMIEGLHLPLCFLAAVGLVGVLSRMRSVVIRRAIMAGVVALMCLSSVRFVVWCIRDNVQDNNESRGLMPPLYLTSGDAAALRALDRLPDSQKQSRAVLCLPKLGNYVPRATGVHVYAGHWAETLYLTGSNGKLAQAINFYQGKMSADAARAWLRQNHIGYIIVGSYERQLGVSLPIESQPFFNENGTTIYAVPP